MRGSLIVEGSSEHTASYEEQPAATGSVQTAREETKFMILPVYFSNIQQDFNMNTTTILASWTKLNTFYDPVVRTVCSWSRPVKTDELVDESPCLARWRLTSVVSFSQSRHFYVFTDAFYVAAKLCRPQSLFQPFNWESIIKKHFLRYEGTRNTKILIHFWF